MVSALLSAEKLVKSFDDFVDAKPLAFLDVPFVVVVGWEIFVRPLLQDLADHLLQLVKADLLVGVWEIDEEHPKTGRNLIADQGSQRGASEPMALREGIWHFLDITTRFPV